MPIAELVTIFAAAVSLLVVWLFERRQQRLTNNPGLSAELSRRLDVHYEGIVTSARERAARQRRER